jgi:hypothetical protein
VVDVERIKVGKRQTIDTMISEEALLFGKYFRHERKEWIPRYINLSMFNPYFFFLIFTSACAD